jgi:catecholate siderophore receptor
MGYRSSLASSLLILLSFGAALARAEDSTVRFEGRVVDQNQAAVAGAHVTATRVGTGIKTETDTTADGSFVLDLSRGEYSLSVKAGGFETLVRAIDLRTQTSAGEAIVLSILPASAEVTVSDDALYVASDTRTATKTFTPLRDVPQSIAVVKQEQIRDQSMSSIADIVRYIPGVSSHQGENNRDDVIIRGNRSSADFFRDGVRDDVQYYRDLYNLDRFEALKGPNAMIFGRGGGGGVVNRVTKEAAFSPIREFTATGGSYRNRRFTGDFGQPIGQRAAFRLNGVYENSDSFRRFVGLERAGINPTFAFSPDSKTSIHVGYEFFRDRRTADRGITSFQNRPVDLPISTYYGDSNNSHVRADVNMVTGSVERLFGDVIFRSRVQYGDYDRFYQNYVPGAVNTAGTLVTLTAYNNATKRKNLFNQTDLTYSLNTGRIRHTFVGGVEFGRQLTDNFRNTGFFNNTATSIQVPFDDPITNSPITFRQSATDLDNHLQLNLAAGFIQDQIEFSRYATATVGVRYDYFDLTYHNNRNGDTLNRVDKLVSPRFGLVVKPVTAVWLYGSYSVSYLPSSGDQFSSLTTVTQQVKPEKFENYEAGLKWDIRRGLFLSTAVYRLDRTNTRATDPNNPSVILQTGSQRTTGFEAGLTGNVTSRWTISGGYAYQNARITSATTAAPVGRQVAQVPHNTFSLWNKYQFTNRLGAGLGLIARSDMFAAIDNTVVLPAYLRADAAVFYTFNEHWRLQANFENITNKRHFVNADSNTNISPGVPRSVKVGLVAKF